MSQHRRVGVYGGAFDPPHAAHVAMVRAVVEQLQLDELRVFPTGDAWHKARVLTPAADRVAMAKIAFAALPRVAIDEREIERSGPTYTVDTLRELRAEMPSAELFLVIGGDQLATFTSWREWEAILGMVTLCIAARASTGSARAGEKSVSPEPAPVHGEVPSVRGEPPTVRGEPPTVRAELVEALPRTARIQFLDLPDMPISATEIRARVGRGEGIDRMVPPGVASYIASHHLYRPH